MIIAVVVYFFPAGALFCTETAKLGPILANFGYFVANLCTFVVLLQGGCVPKLTKIRYIHMCAISKIHGKPDRLHVYHNCTPLLLSPFFLFGTEIVEVEMKIHPARKKIITILVFLVTILLTT